MTGVGSNPGPGSSQTLMKHSHYVLLLLTTLSACGQPTRTALRTAEREHHARGATEAHPWDGLYVLRDGTSPIGRYIYLERGHLYLTAPDQSLLLEGQRPDPHRNCSSHFHVDNSNNLIVREWGPPYAAQLKVIGGERVLRYDPDDGTIYRYIRCSPRAECWPDFTVIDC